MRKIFENGISLLAALGSLGLFIQWYRNTGETEPLIGIIASAGVLLTALVYRIFPEKKQLAPQGAVGYSEEVTSSHPLTRAQTKNAISDSDLNAGRDLQIGDTTTNYINQFINYNGQEIPRALTPAPFDPPTFIGREDALKDLRQKLLGGQDLLLLVNGQGGMGKTSFAAKYWLRYQDEYKHLAFSYVGDGIVSPMLSMANVLGLTFPETMPEQERFKLLLQCLANLEETCLLVLDNANDDEELEKHFQALRRLPNFHVLITSRLEEFQETTSVKVGVLPDEFPLQLFRTHYPSHRPEDDALFWGIFHAVGGNTLVLEVLAKNMREINQNEEFYPFPALLKDLQNRNLLRLSEQSGVKVQWQDMERAKPEDILEAMYDLRPLEAEVLRLLSNLAVLPPENIAYDILKILLRPEDLRQFSDMLTGLYRTGWIEKSEVEGVVFYKASPVVQEVVRLKNTDLHDNCHMLIKTLVDQLQRDKIHENNYLHSALFTRYGETVVAVLEKPDYMLALLNERMGNFYTEIGNLGKAIEYFEDCRDISRSLCESQPDEPYNKNELAISYSKLGDTHSALGNLETALKFYEEFSRLGKELYESYPQNVSFKNGLAISYSKLADTHSALGDLETALKFFEQDNQLEKELYESYPQNMSFKNGLAISYSKLGDTHSALRDLETALKFFEKDLELTKSLYESYPQNVSFKNGLAISYSKLGDTHSALGDLETALKFFEQYNQLKKELYESYPQNVSFKNGLALSYQWLGNIHLDLDNLDRALTFYELYNQLEKELHTSYPQNVLFKNLLAISYSKLGIFHRDKKNDPGKAKPYFQHCYTLLKELSEAYPSYAEFTKNFNWAKAALE